MDVATVIYGDFEWDDAKAAANVAKHGVSFAEGITIFADPRLVYVADGSGTHRLIAIGMSQRARVLCVVHVERGDRDRIISVRKADATEERIYVEDSNNS